METCLFGKMLLFSNLNVQSFVAIMRGRNFSRESSRIKIRFRSPEFLKKKKFHDWKRYIFLETEDFLEIDARL